MNNDPNDEDKVREIWGEANMGNYRNLRWLIEKGKVKKREEGEVQFHIREHEAQISLPKSGQDLERYENMETVDLAISFEEFYPDKYGPEGPSD